MLTRALGVLGLAVLAVGCGRETRPDVVLVVIDTLRADHTSLHGYERDTTPTLVRWAQGGTVFERAYAPSSWTLPSMAMLIEGRARSDNRGGLDAEGDNLFRAVRRAGYHTAAVVSNPLLESSRGYGPDFDLYALYPLASGANINGWHAREVTAQAESVLSGSDPRPLFLWLHYFDPHAPYAPSGGSRFAPHDDPGRRAAFEAALPEEQRGLLTDEVYAGIELRIALYDSEVLQVDRSLRQLFSAIEARGRETLVVLTSDHGEGLWRRASLAGESLPPDHFFPQLYSGHGVMLHEEQVHVPLVLVGPGVPSGERRTEPVWLLDVLPTVARLADLPLRDALHGIDLFDRGGLADRRHLFGITSRGASILEEGRLRLHEPREFRVERHGAVHELYDLADDPEERRPLADDETRRRMGSLLAAWHAEHQAPAREGTDEEQRRLLHQLGYTGGEAD